MSPETLSQGSFFAYAWLTARTRCSEYSGSSHGAWAAAAAGAAGHCFAGPPYKS